MEPTNNPPGSQLAYAMAGVESPVDRLRRQQQQSLAASMWRSGTSMAPVQSPLEGLNRLAQAGLAGWMMNRDSMGMGGWGSAPGAAQGLPPDFAQAAGGRGYGGY